LIRLKSIRAGQVKANSYFNAFVQGQGAGLVRADAGNGTERFNRRQIPNQGRTSFPAPRARDLVTTAGSASGIAATASEIAVSCMISGGSRSVHWGRISGAVYPLPQRTNPGGKNRIP
jgi:hypothetical protein